MKLCRLFIVSAIGALLLAACKPTVPRKYIQPDDMEDILVDFHLAQGIAQQQEGSYEDAQYYKELYFNAVLQKHGITRAEFDSSLVYYYVRADRFQKIYKRVADRLSDQALALGTSQSEVDRYATLSSNGDTANIWADRTEVLLTPHAPYNRFDFSIEADTTFREGDSFMLSFMSDYLYQSGSKSAVAYVTVTYDNDSVVSNTSHLSISGATQLRIAAINKLKAKRIRGFLYLSAGRDDKSQALRLMFVSQLRFIKFRSQQTESEADKKDSLRADSLATDSLKLDSLKADADSAKAELATPSESQQLPTNAQHPPRKLLHLDKDTRIQKPKKE